MSNRTDWLSKIESRWSLWTVIGGSGLLTGWFASLSDWIEPWGPLGWWAAFLLGGLLASIILAVGTWAYGRWAKDRDLRKIVNRSGVNPLEDRFEKAIIFVPDFYNYDYIPHKNKSFKDCRLNGPAMIYILGGSMSDLAFSGCQIVLVRDEIPIKSVTVFKECHFVGGVFSNITLIMTPAVYEKSLSDELKAQIRVINA